MLARIYFHLGSIFLCLLALSISLSFPFSLSNYAKRVYIGNVLSLSLCLSPRSIFNIFLFSVFPQLECKIIITCGILSA